ncbi:MAG: recombination mediator RecR [Kiritimatiellae bacterium]|jgi:recombination protein RecR|nr:recombination mediator RecR [Kiritimatiellia bacterium]
MPEALEQLIRALSRLPGIGKRTAERMAYRLLLRNQDQLRELQVALERAGRELTLCDRCGNLTSHDRTPCRICTDTSRNHKLLCVVEGAPDIQLLEQAGTYPGIYMCLRGKISPMQDETVTRRILEQLIARIGEDGVEEVLLALNTDVESDATCSMLAEVLRPLGVKVTRLAFGLPAGSGIAYSDPVTLQRAMKGRQPV